MVPQVPRVPVVPLVPQVPGSTGSQRSWGGGVIQKCPILLCIYCSECTFVENLFLLHYLHTIWQFQWQPVSYSNEQTSWAIAN